MSGNSYYKRKNIKFVLFFVLLAMLCIPAVLAEPLPSNRHIFIDVANNDGAKYDLDGPVYGGPNNTYYIKADGGGLNELHISNNAAEAYGQVTTTSDQSGVFYVTNTGGRGFDDTIVLLLAVNGTIPDDFSVHIKTSGYNWTPSSVQNQLPTEYSYVEGAVDETFIKGDFIYGPQTWKPGPGTIGVPSLPLYSGQDISDTTNPFQLMFIDLKVGNMYPSKFGVPLENNGASKVEFTFHNLTTFATFNGYGWCLAANQGQGISWTNRMENPGASGFSVVGAPYVPPAGPVAAFTADPVLGEAALTVNFTDTSTGDPTSWAWDFDNDGIVDSSDQNPVYTYTDVGTYSVKLTATNAGGSDSEVKTDYITVSGPGPSPLSDYNNIFVRVANDAGVKYNAFGNHTYNIRFEGVNRGLNALHVSTDPAVNFGQVTVTDAQSGTFYATDSGGKGYEDEIILLVAVNGTIPDDFALHITSDGYTWTPNPASNQPPSLDDVTYQAVALDETFTKDDFIYGPQIWKPTGNEVDYPLYAGQDLTDTENTFHLMFVDLNAGVLRPNTDLENQGAVRINYTFENLDTFAAFSVYGYCQNSNNGENMVAWTNALTPDKAMSGYSVYSAMIPTAGFTANITSGTAPLSVLFIDESTGSPTSWSWSFGDGATSTEQNPVHEYTAEGTYHVSLTVSNAAGSDSEEKPGYITVSSTLPDPPVVNFVGDNRTGPTPLTVHFTDQSTNNPTSWAWDFQNDGIVDSTEQNPTYTFTTPGTYQVNLTASNAGGSGFRLKGNYIKVTQEGDTNPLVDFTADSRTGPAPFTVQFTDQTVTDPTAWAWDFQNDGIIDSTLQNPSYTYTTAGTYQVNLTATNATGTASRLKANFIAVTDPSGPSVATVTVSPDSVSLMVGESQQFMATAYDSGSAVIPDAVFTWSSSNEIVGTINETGYFTALAQGTTTISAESGGESGTGDVEVSDTSLIHAGFTADPESGQVPCIVRFTDTSTGEGITRYEWNFGDGSISTSENPVYIYRSAGEYTVTLKVSSLTGSDTTTGTIVVRGGSIIPGGNVKAQFTASPNGGRAPLEVQFTDRSTGADSWSWEFGDGTGSTEQNPVHVYTSAGTYTVTLSISGEGGDRTTTGLVIVRGGSIIPGGNVKAQFTASPNGGRAPLEVQFTDRSTGADSWSWDFGDGSSSTEQNPVHVYTSAGTYRVTLSISSEGGDDTLIRLIIVRAAINKSFLGK